jgi:serine phosphatase RsbU (regulator of sigma subunit)
MESPDYPDALWALRHLAPADIGDTLTSLARRAGAADVMAYLVDFGQTVLYPVPDRGVHLHLPVGIPVAGTPEGRAYAERQVIEAPADGHIRVWVPITEGPECTGVLALTLPGPLGEEGRRAVEELGLLAGAAIAIAARGTDLFHRVRRRTSMSLAASMQWDLLPPLQLLTPEASSTGLLEPAYDVGGDAFDHAVNGFLMEVAIFDAMGHGLMSSTVSSLTVGTYRHGRRDGQPLDLLHRRLDQVVAERLDGDGFVTGQLARLDLRTGVLEWTNAGHPRPLLVRDNTVVGSLECRPSLPWGLGGPLRQVANEPLQPGDGLIFYTDGVVDGRSADGQLFGLDRFIEIIERASASRSPSDAIVRRAVNEVLAHQEQRLRDDATILWVAWDPDRS